MNPVKREHCPICEEPLDTIGDTFCDRCGWSDPNAPLFPAPAAYATFPCG